MPQNIPVSEARASLPELITALADTGPIVLTRYDEPVAVLTKYDLEADRAHLTHVALLAERADSILGTYHNAPALNSFAGAGFDTVEKVTDLFAALDHYRTTYGARTEDFFIEEALDWADKNLTSGNFLATGFLGPAAARMIVNTRTETPVEWLEAALEVTMAARNQGDRTTITSNGHGDPEEEDYEYAVCVKAHPTPEAFTEAALRLIAQKVPLGSLTDAFGDVRLPADILAKNSDAGKEAEELTNVGMDIATVIDILRGGYDYQNAITLFQGGITTSAEMTELFNKDLNFALISRAVHEGRAPEDWLPDVLAASRYAYKYSGVLPTSVLGQAARHGRSLLRWDNDRKMPGKGTGNYRDTRKIKISENLDDLPWSGIYPDRIIDLDIAGASPGLVDDLWLALDDFSADDVIELIGLGLTTELAKVLTQKPKGSRATAWPTKKTRGPVRPTLDQLRRFLTLGLTPHRAAHFLTTTSDASTWIEQLERWDQVQEATTAFVTDQIERGQWEVPALFREHYRITAKNTYRSGRYTVTPLTLEAFDLLETPEKLNYGHVQELLEQAEEVIADKRFVYGFASDFHKPLVERKEQLRQVMNDFIFWFTPPLAPEDDSPLEPHKPTE
jgi:hypothetical protein